jgi:hypothetical protein
MADQKAGKQKSQGAHGSPHSACPRHPGQGVGAQSGQGEVGDHQKGDFIVHAEELERPDQRIGNQAAEWNQGIPAARVVIPEGKQSLIQLMLDQSEQWVVEHHDIAAEWGCVGAQTLMEEENGEDHQQERRPPGG